MKSGIGLDDLPGALVVYDADGVVVDANRAAFGLLEVRPEQLLGTSAADSGWLLTDSDGRRKENVTHPALTASRSRQPQRSVLVRKDRADGARTWIQVDAVPVLTTDGAVRHVVAMLTDVTRIVMHDSLGDRSSEDQSLAEVSNQLANARLDPEEILRTVTTTLSRLRSGTWVASLINKDPQTVRILAANDADPKVAKYIEAMHLSGEAATTTIAMKVIETGEPVLMPSVPYDEFIGTLTSEVREYLGKNAPPVSSPVRYLGVLVVPMRARGATVGTIGLFERRTSYPLGEKDVRWLQAIADRTGLAAENAQLYVDAKNRLERLTRLRSVGLAISGSPDLRLTLQVILDQVTAGLEVDAADVLLLDDRDEMLELAASAGFQSTATLGYRLPVDESLPGRAVSSRRFETVTAVGDFSHFKRRTMFAREGFKAYGAVRLVARSKLLGVLEVFHRSPMQPDQEWLGFLDALAGEAAIAIDHAAMSTRLEAGSSVKARSLAPDLSLLEKEILGYVVEGMSNKQIAAKVHLSPNTIKFHVHKLLQKVGTGNRTELARKATQEGWL